MIVKTVAMKNNSLCRFIVKSSNMIDTRCRMDTSYDSEAKLSIPIYLAFHSWMQRFSEEKLMPIFVTGRESAA